MRLWCLHPEYLDPQGLVALWREALLAQAVLSNKTKGYKRHPQLKRFQESRVPRTQIAQYLKAIYDEAHRRGYHFDRRKIGRIIRVRPIPVTRSQLAYEWQHLKSKLKARSPQKLKTLKGIAFPRAHPSFRIIPGPVAPWEVVKRQGTLLTF